MYLFRERKANIYFGLLKGNKGIYVGTLSEDRGKYNVSAVKTLIEFNIDFGII